MSDAEPRVTALPDGSYEVVVTVDTEEHPLVATVTAGGDIESVAFEPDPFMTGTLGDPRPIVAAVLAAHHARQT